MEKKFTKIEVLEAIKGLFVEGTETEVAEADIIAFCDKEIENLQKKAVKAKEANAKKKAEGDKLLEDVKAALSDEFETIPTIALRVQNEDATVSKVTYRLGQLEKMGIAEKKEITVDKRKLQGYKLA